MPALTGEVGTVLTGAVIPNRAVSLSGYFGFTYNTNWLLVDRASRITDWYNYCGIPGGIPNRTTIYAALGVPGQLPSYAQSVTAAEVNAALAASPPGQIVQLYPGTYNLGASSITFGTLQQVTLRGSGAGQTIITGTATYITNTSRYFYEAQGIAIANDSGLNKDSTSITLESSPSAGFYAGNLMMITQEDDAVLNYHAYLTEASPGIGTMSGTRNMRFTARITEVSGNTITFAAPIPCGFTYSLNPKAYPMTSNVGGVVAHTTLCGLEDLTLDSTGGLANSVFSFTGADRCWMKDVEAMGFRSSRGGVIFAWSVQCEANRDFLHDINNYPANTEGYGFFLDFGTTHFKLENCITYQLSEGYQSCGTTACSTLYCYDIDSRRANFTWLQPSFNYNHGPCGLMNLFEGNIGQKFQSDGYHGSTSYTTIFRNHVHGTRTVIANPRLGVIDLCRGSYYENVVGNILGDPSWTPSYYLYPVGGSPVSAIYNLGFSDVDSTSFTLNNPASTHRFVGWSKPLYEPDADVAATILRHGNYDYYSDAVVWDGGIGSHSIPDSMFYPSKPAFFGSLAWPPIGPDLGTMVNNIPAKHRWENYLISADLADLFADEV